MKKGEIASKDSVIRRVSVSYDGSCFRFAAVVAKKITHRLKMLTR